MQLADHNDIVASAAKRALAPLGFRRKGRSRVWIADRGFWLSVVEFQPSGWSKGSYLNVAIHWLWSRAPYVLSFDRSERVGQFIKFHDPTEFSSLTAELAELGVSHAQVNHRAFHSLESTASTLVEEERVSVDRRFSWNTLNAGVASGLAGQLELGRRLLREITDWRVAPIAADWLSCANEVPTFLAKARSLMEAERAHYRLPPLETSMF